MKKRYIKYALFFLPVALAAIIYFSNKNLLFKGDDYTQEKEPTYIYGINVDSLVYIQDTIKTGENLSIILQRYNVDLKTIDKLVKKSDTIYDFKKIRIGNPYTVISDSNGKAKCFIYEDNPVDYIVCYLDDSVHLYTQKKDIKTEIRTSAGEINTTLWEAITESKTNPVLAVMLSEILAWSIDFYGIQKGDKFKVIYEEDYVENMSIGINKIFACWFYNENTNHYAFYYVQDSSAKKDGCYFDEKGKSLKKAFLKAPLNFGRITSHFTNSRFHPVLRIYRPHHGIDYGAPTGTPVQSIGDGVVVKKGWSGGGGKTIKIKHNKNYVSSYMHLSRFGNSVREGGRVRQGEIIGYVGSTGLSTGPHLDFRVYKNGSAVNPLKIISPPSKPINKENKEQFDQLVKKYKAKLDSIPIPKYKAKKILNNKTKTK